ncbi:MAG: SDR family NAD(P)-dependent oxidoreductase [Bacteroidetes bacterium]|nr:SDR family NAD(P)-dependent oxidoreductase [Bacteroidota bacterium]
MFDNKVVLITGGSRGIGKAIAERFKLQGTSVAILSKDERRLKKTAEEIHAFGVVAMYVIQNKFPTSVAAAFTTAKKPI